MHIVTHSFQGTDAGIFLYHSKDNAIRKYVDLVRETFGTLQTRTLPQKFTATRLTEQEQEGAMVDDNVEVQEPQFYIDKPLELANLIELVDDHQWHADHCISLKEVEPEDIGTKNNVPPPVVNKDARLPYSYKGIRFAYTTYKEQQEFIHQIDHVMAGNPGGLIKLLYRYHGWFYYTMGDSQNLHLDYPDGNFECLTFKEMHQFIDIKK